MTTMTRTGPAELSIFRLVRLTLRALRLRCPHCGRGTMFQTWLREREHCSKCGLLLNRGLSDYFIGGYLVNLIVAELMVVAGLVGVLLWTWPEVPWTALKWGLVLMMVPAPFLTYPYSKAVWLAIDLHFDPPSAEDFADLGPPRGPTNGVDGPDDPRGEDSSRRADPGATGRDGVGA